MSLKLFCVILDNPNGVFFPGQTVSGKIDFWIAEKKKIKGIFLEVKGSSSVHWTEAGGTENETTDYRSKEIHLNLKVNIIHRGGATFEVGPNNYQYPFSFALPQDLPSSFEGKFGKIRYTIKAKVDRPWKFNYEFKLPFTVNALLDLNNIELAGQGTQGKDTKMLLFTSGPITARAWLDTIGYVPGQNIAFCANVDNKSGKMMKGSKVQLIQYSHFLAKGKSRTSTHILAELKRGGFAQSETWDHVPILIPSVVPSSMSFCDNIRIEYQLQFVVDPGRFSFKMKIPLNLIIGNIPLRQLVDRTATSTAPSVEDFRQSIPPYQDQPPPSYEEAMLSMDIREEDANKVH